MTLSTQQNLAVSAAAASHLVLIATSTGLFHGFQSAVNAQTPSGDIESELTTCEATIAENIEPNSVLRREFDLFARTLRTAYSTFAAQAPDNDRTHARTFALRTAADAFTRITTNARAQLVRSIECQADVSMAQAA